MKVVSCPNQFARFPQPWTRIKAQLAAALNHWFVDGGADIRLRIGPELPSTDGRCLDQYSDPQLGEILFSAERSHSQGGNNLGSTFWWTDGTRMLRARVVIFRGVVSGGVYRDWDWATNADYPGPAQYDFGEIITHEFGHALGLDHSSALSAVMYAFLNAGSIAKRMPTQDDQSALLSGAAYPRSRMSQSLAFGSSNGATWNQGAFTPSPYSVRGLPSACRWGTSSAPYLIADTISATSQLMTARYAVAPDPVTGFRATSSTTLLHTDFSFFGPALACTSASQMLAFVGRDTAQIINFKVSHDGGGTWTAAQPVQVLVFLPTGGFYARASAGTSPALAYLPAASRYVLAFSDSLGHVSVWSTSNEGTTWTSHTVPLLRTTESMGLVCSPTGGSDCSLVLSDASTATLPLTEFRFTLTSGGILTNAGTRSVLGDALGVGATWGTSNNGIQWAWLDRSDIGALKATHISTPGGSLGTVATSSLHLQTPPALAWDASNSLWHAWQSFSSAYDTEVSCNCPPDPTNGIWACHSGACSMSCNANYALCGDHCASNSPPATPIPGQCSADCDCGLPSAGLICSLPTGQCLPPLLLFTRSFSFSQAVPYNGAVINWNTPPTVSGGTFVDVVSSSTSFSLPTTRQVQFSFSFSYSSGGAEASLVATNGQELHASPVQGSITPPGCGGIVAGPPQMRLQLRPVIDGVPQTQTFLTGGFSPGPNTYAPTISLGAGPHTVSLQALEAYLCGNGTPDGTLSPSTFTAVAR